MRSNASCTTLQLLRPNHRFCIYKKIRTIVISFPYDCWGKNGQYSEYGSYLQTFLVSTSPVWSDTNTEDLQPTNGSCLIPKNAEKAWKCIRNLGQWSGTHVDDSLGNRTHKQ